MTKIFISYRRDDSQHMSGRIFDVLVPNFGRENIYKDVDSIMLGQDFREEIKRLITSCDVALAVIGPRWVGDNAESGQRRIDDPGDFVRIEIEFCLARGIPIVPLLIDRYELSRLHDLPASMAKLLEGSAIEVQNDPYFKNDMDIVIQRIRTQYGTEEDRRQQELQALEMKVAQIDQEKNEEAARLRRQQEEEAAQLRQQQEVAAAILRQQQEEAEAKLRQQQEEETAKLQAKVDSNLKEEIVTSLEIPIRMPIAIAAGLFEAGVVGYFAYWLWSTPMQHFGGAFLEYFLIALFEVIAVAPIVLAVTGISLAFTKTKAGAIINLASLIAIPLIVSYLLHLSNPIKTILVVLLSTVIQVIISSIIYFRDADSGLRLPWYVNQSVTLDQRLETYKQANPDSVKKQLANLTASKPVESQKEEKPSSSQENGEVFIHQPGAPKFEKISSLEGLAPCPVCQKPVRAFEKKERKCRYCKNFIHNCKTCRALLSTSNQEEYVTIENPSFPRRLREWEKRANEVNPYSGRRYYEEVRKPDDPYQHVTRTKPCPNCGDRDPFGYIKKYGDTYGLYSGRAVIIEEPDYSVEPPTILPRTDGVYLEHSPLKLRPTCIRIFPDGKGRDFVLEPPKKKENEAEFHKRIIKGYVATIVRLDVKHQVVIHGTHFHFSTGLMIYDGNILSSEVIELDCRDMHTTEVDHRTFVFVPVRFTR